jgi:hypothetical protein
VLELIRMLGLASEPAAALNQLVRDKYLERWRAAQTSDSEQAGASPRNASRATESNRAGSRICCGSSRCARLAQNHEDVPAVGVGLRRPSRAMT